MCNNKGIIDCARHYAEVNGVMCCPVLKLLVLNFFDNEHGVTVPVTVER